MQCLFDPTGRGRHPGGGLPARLCFLPAPMPHPSAAGDAPWRSGAAGHRVSDASRSVWWVPPAALRTTQAQSHNTYTVVPTCSMPHALSPYNWPLTPPTMPHAPCLVPPMQVSAWQCTVRRASLAHPASVRTPREMCCRMKSSAVRLLWCSSARWQPTWRWVQLSCLPIFVAFMLRCFAWHPGYADGAERLLLSVLIGQCEQCAGVHPTYIPRAALILPPARHTWRGVLMGCAPPLPPPLPHTHIEGLRDLYQPCLIVPNASCCIPKQVLHCVASCWKYRR